MPTGCNRDFYCRSYCLLNMFRAPLCPSSGAQEYYAVVASCGISCCGFQVAGLVWSWGLCVRFAGCCKPDTPRSVRGHVVALGRGYLQSRGFPQKLPVFRGNIMFIVVFKKPFLSNVIAVHNTISMILGYSNDVFISYFLNRGFKIFPICPPPHVCCITFFLSCMIWRFW